MEYNTLLSLQELHNETESSELKFVERSSQYVDEIVDFRSKIDSAEDYEQLSTAYTEILKLNTIQFGASQEYLSLLSENRERYRQLSLPARFIVGKRGNHIRSYLQTVDSYYDLELQATEELLVESDIVEEVFQQFKDELILSEFSDIVSDEGYESISANFGMLSPIKKYTDSGYSFKSEGKIKDSYPYSYSLLSNHRRYISNFYDTMRDVSTGDDESAYYKFESLDKQSVDLETDYERLFEEGSDRGNERSKKIAQISLDKFELIEEMKNSGSLSFPIVGDLEKWKEDLIFCQLVPYKVDIYQSLLNQDPVFTTKEDLIRELDKIPPSMSKFLNLFDSSILTVNTQANKYVFECTDRATNEVYTFDLIKEEI